MRPFIDKFKMAGKIMDVCDSTARSLISTLQNTVNNLATVARTGSYNDLTDKPTIPSGQVNSDWNATSGVAEILNKPNLATVATSGSYTDLSNKPTIPSAQVNSDWTATSGVAEILHKPTIPSKTSDLTNDSGFITDTVANMSITSQLNSLPPNTFMGEIASGNTILNVLQNSAPSGVSLWKSQQADDSPIKGITSCCLIGKHSTTGIYSYIYLFGQGGAIYNAKVSGTIPSSLTWNNVTPVWKTSGDWHYYKDIDGIYHMHYKKSNAYGFPTAIGSLYYRTTPTEIYFPFELNAYYSCNVTLKCGSDIVGTCIHGITSSKITLWLWSAVSSSKDIEINIDMKAF